MIARRYPTYRPSGVPWISEIPKGWATVPLFSVLRESKIPNHGLAERNLLSLSFGKIVRKDITQSDGLLPASFESYQIVEPDTIVFRFTDLQNDKRSLRTARATERGIITSAYAAARPTGIDARYVEYLMRAYDTAKVFYGLGGGVRQSLKFDDVARLPVLLPPAREQSTIADYLDRETAKIDTLIEEQQRLIEMLSERRRDVVSDAVLGDANPFSPPPDRPFTAIGHHYSVVLGKMLDAGKGPRDSDELLPYIRAGNIQDDGLQLDDAYRMPYSEQEAASLNLVAGDLLVVEGGAVGTSTVVPSDMPGWSFQKTVNRVRPRGDWSTTWLSYVLRSYRDAGVIDIVCNKSTIPHLTAEKLRALRVPVTDPDEQRRVATYLDEQTAKIDILIAETERFIELSRERRAALITAAVTGQIDVREAA